MNKWWLTISDMEMSNLPWFNVEKGIQRLMGLGVLECICHLLSTRLPWEDPEDIT